MNKGNIIFLNGVSSAGKTTLARALQNSLNDYYFWLSCDSFYNMAPEKFWSVAPLENFAKAMSGLHHTIKTYSDMGLNVIVDHVLENPYNLLSECLELLHDYPVLFVHVTCPAEELMRREKARGDRAIGLSEKQLEILEPKDTYDIIVDTYKNSTEECVNQILEKLEKPNFSNAFELLWNQSISDVE